MVQGQRELIVVGVDGSPSSRDALRWAVREAEASFFIGRKRRKAGA